MVFFPKNVFSFLNCEVFWLKIRKFSNLEKLESMMKKQSILKKKRFHLLKRHLYQDGRRKNGGGSRPFCFHFTSNCKLVAPRTR